MAFMRCDHKNHTRSPCRSVYDRGTRPLPALRQGEPVRIRQEGMWMPAVVVKQHQAPRSYIVATPDGSQLRRNRIDLLPTKETLSETLIALLSFMHTGRDI